MAPSKDNLADSVSILSQRRLDKFIHEYRIPLDLHPVLPSKNETIYPFRLGKFPLYTRVCNSQIIRFCFRVNPFGLSRVNHFEISCRAQNQRPDLDVFRYFYEFITVGDWYTFAHRKGVPPPSGHERRPCLPVEIAWRFKDQMMSFDLGDDFVFKKELAHALIEHKSLIRPLPEHFLLLGRVCFSWGQGDRDCPVIHTKHEPSAAQEIRPPTNHDTSEPSTAEATSSVPTPTKGVARSSGSQTGKKSILDDVDSDPEVRSLDEALQYRPSSISLKSKEVTSNAEPKGLIRKRKNEAMQIRSSDPLPMPKMKKNKKGSSHSGGDVIVELDEHLSDGKSSREEAAQARSAPTPTFSGGFLPVNEVESMEEDQVSSLPSSWFGPELISFFRYADVFSDDMEIDTATADEKLFLDWDIRNKDSVMDELVAKTLLFNINTPLDHARSRKMKNQDLGAMVLSNQAQSNIYMTELYRRWVETESVRENLEKETLSLKRKIQRTPDVGKKIAQLSQDLQAQKEKIKSLTTQNQSSQAAAASA
ncbi:hypothetical protein Hanom_Chr03g00189331 [Helianthus anomalus]